MPEIPQGETVRLAQAVEVANATARDISPICDVCGVTYVDSYRGRCQEPLPPFDGSRTCAGRVDLTPERIAEQAVRAALASHVGGEAPERFEQAVAALEADPHLELVGAEAEEAIRIVAPFIRAEAPAPPPAVGDDREGRVEYRVVGDRENAKPSSLGEFPDIREAEAQVEAYEPSPDFLNVRIQSRTVSESDWTDLPTKETTD